MTNDLQTAARRRPAAFALLELMLAIGLFTAFSLVAYRLISLTLRVSSETSRVEQAHDAFDSAVDRLRRDVWAAGGVEVRDPTTVAVKSTDGATLTWNVDKAGLLARAEERPGEPADQSQWHGAGAGVTFRAADAGLVVEVAGKRGHDRASIRLVTQRALAEGMR